MQILSDSDTEDFFSLLQRVTLRFQQAVQQQNRGKDESTATDAMTTPIEDLTNFIKARSPQHQPSELEQQQFNLTFPSPSNKRQSPPSSLPQKKRFKQAECNNMTGLETPEISFDTISKFVHRKVFFSLKYYKNNS